MRGNRYIAIILLIVSFVMLTMSFIPHHHHWHTICMQNMCDDEQQHHDNPKTCCVGCITYFHCQQQNHEKVFFIGFYGAFPYDSTKLIPRPYEIHSFQAIIDHSCGFLTQWERITRGLRAPPSIA